MGTLTTDQYNQVKQVFNSKGIPDSVWVPIMMVESGGDPNARTNTSREDSRGLFQVNIKSNPEYRGTNLYDPVTNAQIAAEKFLGPAYQKALVLSRDGGWSAADVTAYTERYGNRPQWTTQLNDSLRSKVNAFLQGGAASLGLNGKAAQSSDTSGAGGAVGGLTNLASWNPADILNNLIDRFKAASWNFLPLLLGIVLLILVFFKMFADYGPGIQVKV